MNVFFSEGKNGSRVGLFLTCLLGWVGVGAEVGRAAEPIPDRPEKLVYPTLNYQPPKPADYRVELKSGPVAYVVPDRELPLVNIVVHMRVGQFLEPVGQEGLASAVGYLLARGGTASKTAEDLEERLAFLAANLQSSVASTRGSVSLNLLSKDLDEGMNILREVLTAPKFQEDKLDLFRQQRLQEIKQRNDDSADIEDREKDFLSYGENFWANRLATQASLESIRREHLVQFHQRWFHPDRWVVAVSGDFDRADMIARLEKLFSNWPFQGEKVPAIPTDTSLAKAGTYLVNKDVNQGRVSLILPGVLRQNPDYFAIAVMNRILGGGGFISRIMNRVRSDEGLAYSASSSFQGGVEFAPPFEAGFQSKSRTVAYASSIVVEEIKKMAAEPVTAEELKTARQTFIENLPRRFATKTLVADAFADEEFTGRYATDPEYWQKYRDRLGSISGEDVQRVAKKYLDPSRLVILVVGQKDEILKGHPDHPVKLSDLTGGVFTELPLRDPLTLKPLPVAAASSSAPVEAGK